MRQALAYTLIVTLSLLWLAGCSSNVQRWLGTQGVLPDDYRYGDLYRLSNLSRFKAGRSTCFRQAHTLRPRVHLYVIGDSFLEETRIKKEDFGVEKYTYLHWKDSTQIVLDSNAVNLLLIETVERHAREHLAKAIRNYRVGNSQPETKAAKKDWLDFVFPTNVEEKLERLLFSNDIALYFRELKAELAYRWFGRLNDQVAISKDGLHLFTSMDTDTTTNRSSYSHLSDAELRQLAISAQESKLFYQNAGFDGVIFSIIPNKASILAPFDGNYNHLVEKLESRLSDSVISVYGIFTQNPSDFYEKSDSHWNCLGENTWLKQANLLIDKQLSQKIQTYPSIQTAK